MCTAAVGGHARLEPLSLGLIFPSLPLLILLSLPLAPPKLAIGVIYWLANLHLAHGVDKQVTGLHDGHRPTAVLERRWWGWDDRAARDLLVGPLNVELQLLACRCLLGFLQVPLQLEDSDLLV
jgi:hypothetical protein